jgi:para-aminobenzoate synthetase component I
MESWVRHELAGTTHAADAVRHSGPDEELAWLDGAGEFSAADGRARGLLCRRPLAVLDQFEGQPATLRVAGRVLDTDRSGWALWRRAHARLPRFSPAPGGLGPGWVGYVGFEKARELERLPARHRSDLGLPLMRLALFDRGMVFGSEAGGAVSLTADGVAEALGIRPAERSADWVRPDDGVTLPPADQPATVQPAMSRAAYERMIRRARDYIAAGDIYQVNLAQRFRIENVGEPLGLYLAVRRTNPAPYAAFLRWGDNAVASFSPELFLQLRGAAVLTSPIKGTRPHTGDPALDERYRRELLGSAKEAAELAMIIDLHRNDLGRVCCAGSVRVAQPRRLEVHPTVLHTVADVVGTLRADRDAFDLLTACFPAGSISGVPKIRALEIIDELEPAARGVYTGAVGVLGLDGQMTFNVAIRTLQIRGRAATLYVGGGIVADSEPAAEYAETLAKARGIVAGITRRAPSAEQTGPAARPAP